MPLQRLYLASAVAVALLVGAGAWPNAAPAAAAVADLPADQQALVARAGDYLQRLGTVTGRFTQTDPNGGGSTGTLYLQRPGKARFEYDPPAGLLVVSDGSFVGVSDRRLKTFNEYPLGRTPLALLLARQVRLDRGAVVTAVQQSAEGFSIGLRDARGQAEGRLTLLFRNDPVALRGWNIVDAQGRRTEVRLGPLAAAEHLAPGLFYIRDPRH